MISEKLIVDKEKFISVVFLAAYTTFFAFSTFGHIAMFGTYLKYMTYVGIFLLIELFILRLNEYSGKEGLVFISLILYSLFIAYKTNDYGYFKLILMIVVSKGVGFNSCIKYDAILRIINISIMLFLYYIGIAPDYPSVVGTTIRHSMGFRNPNNFGLMIFILSLEYLYLVRLKLNLKLSLPIIFLIIFEYKTSGSRTAEIFMILAMCIYLIYSKVPSLFSENIVERVMQWVAPVGAAVTYIIYLLFDSGNVFMKQLDMIFSGRITNISYYSELYNISFLGRNTGMANRTLDSLYAYLYFSSGIIVFLLVMVAYITLIRDLCDYSNIPMAIIMSLLFLYGLSEKLWFQPDYNLLMISFRQLIYHDVLIDNSTYVEQALIDY